MLITSKTTNRFIVPKGWPMNGISGRKTAVAEAWEEAGVVGEALKEPLASTPIGSAFPVTSCG